MSGLNLVDSSGWLEYLVGSDRARLYSSPISATSNLIVPVISIYEVVKRILREGDDEDANQALQAMTQGTVVDVDYSIALDAVRLRLPTADSIIYATAQRFNATLWTQDEDFEGLPGVRYFPKQ